MSVRFFGVRSNIDEHDVVFLPYKILGNNKAIYWASPELKIIGAMPEFLIKNAKLISSEKP